jgi:hypothetical protein
MDIFSKKSGSRAEDQPAKQHLQRNWGTIEKLADTLSNGQYSANKAKKAAPPPQSSGLIFVDHALPRAPDTPDPYLRISTNGRVVVADRSTNVQLHFLGELRRQDGEVRFVIATKENGYISPLDADLLEKIDTLANRTVNRAYSEDDLARDLKDRLHIA